MKPPVSVLAAFVAWSPALLSPALPPPALEAQDDAIFVEEIDVRLVELEVHVTGARGQPVTGLGRSDFEVRQGRKRLEVTHFAAFEDGHRRAGAAAPDVPAAPRTAQDRLYLVLYVDHAYLVPGELEDVVQALRAFLDDGLRPKDRVMLVEANHSLEIRHPFTTLTALIDGELQRLEPRPPGARAMAEYPRLLQEIERVAQRGSDVPGLSSREHPMTLKAEIDSFAGQTHRELALAAHQLHRLIPALAGLPGRKELLYVGGTLPTDASQRLYSAWNAAFGPSSIYQQQRGTSAQDDDFGRLVNTTPAAAAAQADTNELFRKIADLANSNKVKLHVLDAGGLRRSASLVASRGATITERGSTGGRGPVHVSRRLGDPQVLRTMAETTGGRALVNSRTFRTALADVRRDLGTYYVLAFRPPKDDGDLHEVRVKLAGRRRGLEVRYRRAYRSRSRDRVAADQVVAALTLGEADNPLGIELAVDPPRPAEGPKSLVRLPLYVIFPVGKLELVPGPEGHRGQVSIYLTSGDLERGAAEVQKTVVPLRFASAELEEARGRNVEYKLELPMAADSRKVAVVLRDDLRPLSSSAVLLLSDPKGRAERR